MKKPPQDDPPVSAQQMNEMLRDLLSILQPELAELADSADDPLHQLPPPPYLIGREALLAELIEGIESGIAAGVVLCGPTGAGRTALALKLAEQLTTLCDDAQLFLDLQAPARTRFDGRALTQDQPVSLTAVAAMRLVLQAFHPTKFLPDSEVELSRMYRQALRGRRTLLVFDNVADAAQLEALLPPAGGVLIATAGSEFAPTAGLAGILVRQVGALSAADSRELLLGIAPNLGKQAQTPADLCEGWPLALELAAGVLATQKKLTVAGYVKKLTERRADQPPVAAVLSLNNDLMPPIPQGLWHKLAVFPADFDADAAAAVWEMASENPLEPRISFVDTCLNHLQSRRLLHKDEQTERYRMHDATRAEAVLRVDAAEALDAARIHAGHYLDIVRTAAILHKSSPEGARTGLDLCRRELANIVAGQAWASAKASDQEAADKEAAELTVDYFLSGLPVLILRLNPDEILQWLRDAIEAARATGKPEKEIALWGELGSSYQDVGRNASAVECLQQAMAAARRLNDRKGEQKALGGLGDAYHALGELTKAIEIYQQYLSIVRQEGDPRLESYLLNNLGAVYGKLNRTPEAMACFERQLELTRETGDRAHEARVRGNLGVACINDKRAPEALEHFQQAIALQRELGNRTGEAEMLAYLGGVYFLMKEMNDALEAYEQAVALYRRLGDRRGESDMLWHQSLTLDHLGDRAGAIQCAQTALKLRQEMNDPRTAEIRRRLTAWRNNDSPRHGH